MPPFEGKKGKKGRGHRCRSSIDVGKGGGKTQGIDSSDFNADRRKKKEETVRPVLFFPFTRKGKGKKEAEGQACYP